MSLFTRRSSQTEFRPARPAIESLESRAYFSLPTLVITLPGTLRPSAIAGVTVNEKIAVNVANDGPGSLKGPFSLALFASVEQTLGVDASQLVAHAYPGGVVIGSGKNRTFTLNVKAYPENLNADYFILAQVSQGNTGAMVGTSTATIDVTPKTIDLSGVVLPLPANGKIGHTLAVTLDVSNGGNVMAQGNLPVNFGESTSMTGSSPVNLETLSKHIHIEPGKTQVLHFHVSLPLGIPSGNQFIVADVDPADVFNESNLTDKIAISPDPVSLT